MDKKQILRVILDHFLVHVAKITESCVQLVKVSGIKYGDIVKTSIKNLKMIE